MVVVQINAVYGLGSTGKISYGISEALNKRQIENYVLFSNAKIIDERGIKCAPFPYYTKIQALLSKIIGNYGFNSIIETCIMIRKIKRIKPDVVHIHNIHSHDCHVGILLNYLKKHNIKVIWTFHDCWAFTAYCPHYAMEKCDKWCNGGCSNCQLYKNYSWFFDRSKYLFEKKKKAFINLNLTVVTPSKWLANQVSRSFLKDTKTVVINNGIDLTVFKPVSGNFREKHRIPDSKFVILGVAAVWSRAKGLDVFVELSKRLNTEYQIVLVGVNEKTKSSLPDSIICIERTNNQAELAEIYSSSDLFLNPTREEVLGLVNIEALACGTPVLTFNAGGAPECFDSSCGSVVEIDDIDAIEKEIKYIKESRPYSESNCIKMAEKFDMWKRFDEYVDLYIDIVEGRK